MNVIKLTDLDVAGKRIGRSAGSVFAPPVWTACVRRCIGDYRTTRIRFLTAAGRGDEHQQSGKKGLGRAAARSVGSRRMGQTNRHVAPCRLGGQGLWSGTTALRPSLTASWSDAQQRKRSE